MSANLRLSRLRMSAVTGMLTAITAFYCWTASTSEWPARPAEHLPGYYDLMANAFLAGQTNLLVQPPPQLLALKDPYDPIQNVGYRLHDAALFNGKYYLYYGPTPALVLFAPFRWVTGLDFPEPLAAALFCSIGLLFSWLVVWRLSQMYLPQTSFWLVFSAIPALGFGNVAPFLLRRPLHYEVAIAGVYAFVFASVYYFVIGTLRPVHRNAHVALASLLLGLAGGARFVLLAAGLIPMALWAYAAVNSKGEPFGRRVLTAVAFFGPVSACVFLLGLYNHIRFASWTDFGLRYTLQGFQSAREYVFYSLIRAPVGIYYYVLAPPAFVKTFPFVLPQAAWFVQLPAGYYLEPVVGILPAVPLNLILLLWPLSRLTFRRSDIGLYLVCGASLVVGLALLGLYCLSAGTMRYEVDFGTFFLIPALLLWYAFIDAVRNDRPENLAAKAVFVVMLLVTVTFSAAFSVTGYYDNLKWGSPATYKALKALFLPLERALR